VSSENDSLRERSGSIKIDSKLVSFLYELMRDHVPPGVVEKLVQDSQMVEVKYTNGWLARYAEDLANRLVNNLEAVAERTGDCQRNDSR
jgi:hypothetical protein